MARLNKVAVFTKEYPPYVYGGAGVHVEYLCRELARLIPVEVRCFGDQAVQADNLSVKGYPMWDEVKQNTDPRFVGAIDAFARSLAIAKDNLDADIVHCHTWYTDMAGLLAGKLWDVPSVLTIHSLEPLRPWKVEQLGNAYHLSAWMEKTAIEQADAIIAVSQETRQDVLRLFDVPADKVHVIYNGIDLEEYHKTEATDALVKYGIDPNRPYMLFVGRITRQKGIIHLVKAIPDIDPSLQIVLCAGAPDTPEIGQEMKELIEMVRATRKDVYLGAGNGLALRCYPAIFTCDGFLLPFGL